MNSTQKIETRETDGTIWYQVAAPAKVNLSLRVIGRRDDDYHLLSMLNARLALSDQIQFSFTKSVENKENITIESFHVGTNDQNVDPTQVGVNPQNTVVKAITLFRQAFRSELTLFETVSIVLQKNIPIGGGLGGGSSDGAATLRLLANRYFEAAGVFPPNLRERLNEIALRIGADTPFFMYDLPVAQVGGIGEQVTIPDESTGVADIVGQKVVLIVPPFPISTAESFRRFRDGGLLFSSESSHQIGLNDLCASSFLVSSQLEGIFDALRNISSQTGLSGSGSCLFCLDPSTRHHREITSLCERFGARLIDTRIC